MTAFADLIARVEAAEGPDRQLDREIGLALGDLHVGEKIGSMHLTESTGRGTPALYRLDSDGDAVFGGLNDDIIVRHYTGSLEAAFRLASSRLPGWLKFVGDLDPSDMRACATLAEGLVGSRSERGFASPGEYARAVCAAVLKALSAQGEGA